MSRSIVQGSEAAPVSLELRSGRNLIRILALAAVIVAAAFAAVQIIKRRDDRAEAAAAKQRIPLGEVEVSDFAQNGDSLDARVRNRSTKYTLKGLRVKLAVWDELGDGVSELVAEDLETARLLVPPGQARKMRFSSGSDLPRPVGPRKWLCTVVETDGEIP